MSKENDYLYIFLHIPKTGGTTIRENIKIKFKDNEIISLNKKSGPISIINSLNQEEKNNIKVIMGHLAWYGIHNFFPDKTPRYITIIRNPINQRISLYNYFITKNKLSKDIDYYEFCKNNNHINNSNLRILIRNNFINNKDDVQYLRNYLEENNYNNDLRAINKIKGIIKEALSKFYFIGITESSSKDFPYVYNFLDINNFILIKLNKSNNYIQNKNINDIKKNIIKDNKLDELIYGEAININSVFKKNNHNFEPIIKKIRRNNYLYATKKTAKYFIYRLSLFFRMRSKLYSTILDKIKEFKK